MESIKMKKLTTEQKQRIKQALAKKYNLSEGFTKATKRKN